MARIRMLREGGLVLVGQLAAVLGMLAGTRLITELLLPEQYGELALGLTVSTLVTQTLFGPLANASTRFYAPAVEKNCVPDFRRALWPLVRRAALVASTVLVAVGLGTLIMGYSLNTSLIVFGALAYTTHSGVSAVFSGIQNAARQRGVVAFHQVLDVWLRISLAVSLLIVFESRSSAAIIGYALGTGVVVVSQSLFYRRLVGRLDAASTDAETWRKDIWHYAWPFSAWGIFTWAQLASDRWALDWFGTRSDVGHLGVLAQFGYAPVQLATTIVVQFITPIMFQRAGDADEPGRIRDAARIARNLTLVVLSMTTAAFIVTLWFHTQLFHAFIASEYRSVSYLLPWVVLSSGIFAASQAVTLKLLSQLRARAMLSAKIGTAILGIALNLVGARYFGIVGVVAANLAFSVASLVWMLALARLQHK